MIKIKLPSWIYRSDRIGRGGKVFSLLKFRTMVLNADKTTQFATPEVYTKWGHTLRKYKLDEFPQVLNILKGDMTIVGPRPDFQTAYDIMPIYARDKILSVKPGLTSLSSIYFYNEEELLQGQEDKLKIYWTKIKPAKTLLDSFYIENKCFLLDLAIIWLTFKCILKTVLRR